MTLSFNHANTTKNHPTSTELQGESSEVYGIKLSFTEQKILMNIQLWVICVDKVDFNLQIYTN